MLSAQFGFILINAYNAGTIGIGAPLSAFSSASEVTLKVPLEIFYVEVPL